MVVPQNRWFIMENAIYQWMMSGGYPYDSGILHLMGMYDDLMGIYGDIRGIWWGCFWGFCSGDFSGFHGGLMVILECLI